MTAGAGGIVALLDTLTFPETITILVIALIVLGPEKLPGMARTIGEWLARLRRLSANLQSEVQDVMDDPSMQPLRELGELATSPRRKLAEYALAAEAEISEEEAAAILDGADDATDDATDAETGMVTDVTEEDGTGEPPAADLHGPDHPMESMSPVADDDDT